jgi:predicted PurR-regulated permease PerM
MSSTGGLQAGAATESEPGGAVTPAIETQVRGSRHRQSPAAWSLAILAGVALVAGLHFAQAFFVPLMIGILASYALRPVVDWLHRLRIPQAAAAALVVGVLISGLSWIGYRVGDQAIAMAEKLPEAARKLRSTLEASKPSAIQNVQEAATELQRAANEVAATPGKRVRALPAPGADSTAWIREYALAQSALLLSIAAKAPIVLLLAYFLLASGDYFRRKMIQFAGPSLSKKKDVVRLLEEVDAQVQHYRLVLMVCNALVGFGVWLGFQALGLEQAGVWGVFAAVMQFMPYLGPLVLAATAGVAGFMQSGSMLEGFSVAGVGLLVAGAMGMALMTWMQSRVAHVNAAVLFIALLFFGWLWGIAGLLLGAPLVAIARVVCARFEALRPVAELLGN